MAADPGAPRIAVAASGGRDSTALLHATACAARDQGVTVHALHVHHGLLPEADAWARQVCQQARRWARRGLPVTAEVVRLAGAPAAGESVEAWARRERYRALARAAQALGVRTVLLAHHRRDQAETLLLQALRGAGAAGMAAMPASVVREGIAWERPWLDQPREAIEAYVRAHRLSHVDDPSNQDVRFARSRLRASVWPALTAAFPQAETVLAGAARRLHEADACAKALAEIDAQACVQEGGLVVKAWRALTPERQANLLRSWLARPLPAGVPDSLVRRLVAELPTARGGSRWPAPVGGLVLQQGALRWEPEAALR